MRVVFTAKRTTPDRAKKRRAIVSSVRGHDGSTHEYLNAAIPVRLDANPADSVCYRCSKGYSHILERKAAGFEAGLCWECHNEDLHRRAVALQEELEIDLGWVSKDPVTDRRRHGYRDPFNMCFRDAW